MEDELAGLELAMVDVPGVQDDTDVDALDLELPLGLRTPDVECDAGSEDDVVGWSPAPSTPDVADAMFANELAALPSDVINAGIAAAVAVDNLPQRGGPQRGGYFCGLNRSRAFMKYVRTCRGRRTKESEEVARIRIVNTPPHPDWYGEHVELVQRTLCRRLCGILDTTIGEAIPDNAIFNLLAGDRRRVAVERLLFFLNGNWRLAELWHHCVPGV